MTLGLSQVDIENFTITTLFKILVYFCIYRSIKIRHFHQRESRVHYSLLKQCLIYLVSSEELRVDA